MEIMLRQYASRRNDCIKLKFIELERDLYLSYLVLQRIIQIPNSDQFPNHYSY